MIGEIKASTSATLSQPDAAQAQVRTDAPSQTEKAKSADTVELGAAQNTPVTYSKPSRKSAVDVSALKSAADQRYENLRTLVEQMLKKQHEKSGKALNHQYVSQDSVNQAQQAISEDGDFGVKAVSDRIVKFAIAVSGGDKAQYDKLKAAIDKGFQQAAKSLGGLPDISQQTYDEVMRKLDEWKNGDEDTAA